jgi:hypothetical protein
VLGWEEGSEWIDGSEERKVNNYQELCPVSEHPVIVQTPGYELLLRFHSRKAKFS